MLPAHAYKAQTDGSVCATRSESGTGKATFCGYVGLTTDPEGEGDLLQTEYIYQLPGESAYKGSISFLVAKDDYFEITGSGAIVIFWKSIGPLIKPIDQD